MKFNEAGLLSKRCHYDFFYYGFRHLWIYLSFFFLYVYIFSSSRLSNNHIARNIEILFRRNILIYVFTNRERDFQRVRD